MLPEPLPDEEDDPDIDPEVENEDDLLDLLPDDEPLLDEPLLDPDIDPDPEPPEPEPDPDDALPEPELWAVAGMSTGTHTPSASSVLVPGMWMATVVGARRCGRPTRLPPRSCARRSRSRPAERTRRRRSPTVAAADHKRVFGCRLQAAVDDHESVVLTGRRMLAAGCDGRRAVQTVVRKPVVFSAVGHIDFPEAGHLMDATRSPG